MTGTTQSGHRERADCVKTDGSLAQGKPAHHQRFERPKLRAFKTADRPAASFTASDEAKKLSG
jgi:hypothetical protein